MAQERSSHRLLRHACSTCGINEIVVSAPAIKPSKDVRRMHERYQNEKEHAKLAACPVFLTSILNYIKNSFVCRVMGCCISSSSFLTWFRPYTRCSKSCDMRRKSGATLAYSKCSNFETM